jgi:hypothetical protein
MPLLDAQALNRAENELQQSVLAGDVAALAQLLHDDVRFTGPDGRLVTTEQDLETHRSGVLEVTSFSPRQDVLVVGDAGSTLVEADVAGPSGESRSLRTCATPEPGCVLTERGASSPLRRPRL